MRPSIFKNDFVDVTDMLLNLSIKKIHTPCTPLNSPKNSSHKNLRTTLLICNTLKKNSPPASEQDPHLAASPFSSRSAFSASSAAILDFMQPPIETMPSLCPPIDPCTIKSSPLPLSPSRTSIFPPTSPVRFHQPNHKWAAEDNSSTSPSLAPFLSSQKDIPIISLYFSNDASSITKNRKRRLYDNFSSPYKRPKSYDFEPIF
eukprot:Sdes_comp21370_c0_seq1m20017